MDISKIKPHGPWVLLKLDSPILYEGAGGPCQKSTGGIFIPATAAQDKRGYCRAILLAKGNGELNPKTGVRTPLPINVGSSVYIRWYLSELHRPYAWDNDHCFLHQKDLLLVIDDDRYIAGITKNEYDKDHLHVVNVDAVARAMRQPLA